MRPLNIYRSESGVFVAFDGCMQASIHEQHELGPLTLCGQVDGDALPQWIRNYVEGQFANSVFAVMPGSIDSEFFICREETTQLR